MSATTSKGDNQKRSPSSNRTSELRTSRGLPRSGGAVVIDTNVRRLDEAREIANLVAVAGLGKKAENVQIIEVTGKVDYADFLVLMTGTSDRHVAAIAQNVESDLAQQGGRRLDLQGLTLATARRVH